MKDLPIFSLRQYFELLNIHKALLFRGVSNATEHKLIPSIARGWNGIIDELIDIERDMLDNLILRSAILLNNPPDPSNYWEWLILGQHHGMPTRLLDWTTNPLVALYFACGSTDFNEDGAVYLLDGLIRLDPKKEPNPFSITADYYLAPRHITARIPSQSAFFTVQMDPTQPLAVRHSFLNINVSSYQSTDDRIIVPSDVKPHILKELQQVGINAATLFPGLDGLCKQIAFEGLNQKDTRMRFYSMKEELIKLNGKKTRKKQH